MNGMQAEFESESQGLLRSWMKYDADLLRHYLVAGVEDPRLNIQSVLTRHFLLEYRFGRRFLGLMQAELHFSAVLNWCLRLLKGRIIADDLAAIQHALERGADNAEGIAIPAFVTRTFSQLPLPLESVVVPNYLSAWLGQDPEAVPAMSESVAATFGRLWSGVLAGETAPRLAVLEPACGSANDFRFLDRYGLAAFLDYHGLDLCPKNIANAQEMFPGVAFSTGNVLDIEAGEKQFDLCFVHDLFEHLSPPAMEAAFAELVRVTRRGICAHFFSMAEAESHVARPVDDYHWNTVSFEQVRSWFESRGAAVQVFHIASYLGCLFNDSTTHNPNAYTLMIRWPES